MKKAIIIYNEGAGFGNVSFDELEETLNKEGYETSSCSLTSEGFPSILQQPCDLVVAAGGDGTVKAVVLHLSGKVPVLIWPMGTSNNIGTTFGAAKRNLNLRAKKPQELNIAVFQEGEKRHHFVESAGIGLLSRMMEEMIKKINYASKQEKIHKSLEILLNALQEQKEMDIQLYLDEELYHDKYLAVEIMNIPYAGPRLFLAPEAAPGDGYFDVVLISKKQENDLVKYLSDRLEGKQEPIQFPVYRAREVKIVGKGLHLHVDDDLFYSENEREYLFTLQEESAVILAEEKEK